MAFITINKAFLYNNLDYISKVVGGKDKICLVIKNNAYGHGIIEIASLIKSYGIKNVYVKNDTEAKVIENFCFDSVIVSSGKGIYQALNVSHVINDLSNIENYPIGTIVELNIDTGMHRDGINPTEIEKAILIIKKRELFLKGVYTHFQSSDEDNDFIYKQEEVFNTCVNKIKKLISYGFRVHCSNSHGIHKINNQNYDFARIGIAAYGYFDLYPEKLTPILSLYAEKKSTKVLCKGDRIGYGSNGFIVDEDDFIVSNYDIGYGDGFLRLDENNKYILLNGKQITGIVSMDSLSVACDSDTVLLFNDVRKLARTHNTIVYEILTSLKHYIPRYIIQHE